MSVAPIGDLSKVASLLQFDGQWHCRLTGAEKYHIAPSINEAVAKALHAQPRANANVQGPTTNMSPEVDLFQ